MSLVNIGHELTYHYNRCQNAKKAIFFKLIVEIKKKTYISYVFMYMYVKIASTWPQN